MGQLSALLTPVVNGLGASIGHLIATESEDKTYEVFKVVNLVNFWIYSFSTIFLFNLLEVRGWTATRKLYIFSYPY